MHSHPCPCLSDQIVVEYTAKLNENAVIGAAGNPNKVSLKFSNNPNNGGAVSYTHLDVYKRQIHGFK